MVISTGMTWPAYCCVCSLYCRQKSMMLTPCWPRAVPTGGAGVAWPALIWSLTRAATFLRLRRAAPPMLSPPAVQAAREQASRDRSWNGRRAATTDHAKGGGEKRQASRVERDDRAVLGARVQPAGGDRHRGQ